VQIPSPGVRFCPNHQIYSEQPPERLRPREPPAGWANNPRFIRWEHRRHQAGLKSRTAFVLHAFSANQDLWPSCLGSRCLWFKAAVEAPRPGALRLPASLELITLVAAKTSQRKGFKRCQLTVRSRNVVIGDLDRGNPAAL
jgi:hypothetical protein